MREQSVAESFQQRREGREELLFWQPSPLRMPHGLMATGTATAHYVAALLHTCENGGKPFAMLHDAIGLSSYGLVFTEHVQGFCPIPFRTIDATFISRIVGVPTLAKLVDFCSFLHGCMVFPKHEHRIGVLCKLWEQGEGSACLVCKARRTAGGIEGDAHHLLSNIRGTLSQCFLDGGFQYLQIVQWVLAILILRRIAIQPFRPARIIFHAGGQCFARIGVHH